VDPVDLQYSSTPTLDPSALLRPISIAHLGESLLVANGDSLVNDHKSNEGLHPSIPQEEGTCDTREACPLIEYSGLFF
jgi:hypothetical protein